MAYINKNMVATIAIVLAVIFVVIGIPTPAYGTTCTDSKSSCPGPGICHTVTVIAVIHGSGGHTSGYAITETHTDSEAMCVVWKVLSVHASSYRREARYMGLNDRWTTMFSPAGGKVVSYAYSYCQPVVVGVIATLYGCIR